MAVYLHRIIKQGRAFLISIPASWRKERIGPDDRYLFAVETAQGTLEIFPERSYYEQKFNKSKSPRDTGTGEVYQGEDRPDVDPGVSGQSEQAGSVTADLSEDGVERISD